MLNWTRPIHDGPTTTATETGTLEATVAKRFAGVAKFVVVNGNVGQILKQESLSDIPDMLLQLWDDIVVLIEGTPNSFGNNILFTVIHWHIDGNLRWICAQDSGKKAVPFMC
jgi:hypothetical protein